MTLRLMLRGVSTFLLLSGALSGAAAQGFEAVSLESRVIDNFDEDATTRWIARGSKFTTMERDENGNVVRMYPITAAVNGYPQALFGRSKDNPDRQVLGIFGKFDRRGYNFIEIVPAREADADTPDSEIIYEDIENGTRWVHAPIELPGKIQYVDLWVWGSNLNYYMEMDLRDYRGIDHTINMGNLTYFGWKNLRVGIPTSIPQSSRTVPRYRGMELTKFVLWTRPEEQVDQFFVYLDHLKVLTDLFQSRYDGDELEDPELLQEVWGVNWD